MTTGVSTRSSRVVSAPRERVYQAFVDRDELLAWLQDLGRESRQQNGELQVLIRADRSVRSAFVNQLLPKLNAEGISTVQFSVQGVAGNLGDSGE